MNHAGAVEIASDLYRRMVEHCRREVPREAIGLLGGATAQVASCIVPMTNLVGAGGFFVHPREQFRALRSLREAGCVVVGTYHSHPFGAPELSPLDVRLLARWPCVHVIVVPAAPGEADRAAAYRIEASGPHPIALGVT